jgi:hypothetical protein
MGKRRNGHELRRLARRGSDGSDTALKGSDSFLKDIDGWLVRRVSFGAISETDSGLAFIILL